MGLVASKIFGLNERASKKSLNTKSMTTKGLKEPDEMQITSTTCENLNLNNEFKNFSMQQTKSLKNLPSDPRSPTIGIYRTPIIVEDDNLNDGKFSKCDSPVSIYSSNMTSSLFQDVITPTEPSINVSGFEDFSILKNTSNVVSKNKDVSKHLKKVNPLKISDEPSTMEAKKLLKEISKTNGSFNGKSYEPISKQKKAKCKVNNEKMVPALKNRTPLSNITSSGNSTSPLIQSGKLFSRTKALAEYGSENLVSPIGNHLAQWDKNSTVIL